MIVEIELGQCRLHVEGEYYKGDLGKSIPDYFEIDDITLNNGDLFDLIEYCDSKEKWTILNQIEEKCLEKLR